MRGPFTRLYTAVLSHKRISARFFVPLGVFALGIWLPAAMHGAVQTQGSPANSAGVQRGSVDFAKSGCARCHGENGIGGRRGPNLKDVGDHLSSKRIRAQIVNGGKMMPAYGKILSSKQVNDLVQYLSAHRDAGKTPPTVPQ